MLQGQKLQQAYDDYIINYSVEKGLETSSIQNKKDVLKKLLPFLDGKPLTFETCREYGFKDVELYFYLKKKITSVLF
jgi:hypothetical protein